MDLDVMAQHKSPHIVNYFGSVIWNVSTSLSGYYQPDEMIPLSVE